VTGEISFRIPVVFRRISRTRLRRVCARGLDIRWGTTLEDLQLDSNTGPVTMRFEGGESAKTDLVIGADGSNSRVRLWLLGESASKPLDSDFTTANGIVKYGTAEQSLAVRSTHPVSAVATIPTGLIFTAGKLCGVCVSFGIW
jgi:2-polyprenyl-6-methoxyphenol hydroxylase-like FAD-dependent oxidoreductase